MPLRENYCLLAEILVAQIRHDSAAKTYGPAMISIGEENSFKRVLCATVFGGPMLAAVARVNDRALRAYGPAFDCINKLHVEKIDLDR